MSRTASDRPSRNQDFKRPRRLLARPRHPVSTSTWPPDASCSAHRRPVYVSFISKAVLWEKGLSRATTRSSPSHHPSVCPRFLSHMKSVPGGLRPPCFLSSTSRPQPPSQERTPNPLLPSTALKPQTLEGNFHPTDRGRKQNVDGTVRRRPVVVVPCHPPPGSPPSSSVNPPSTVLSDSRRQQSVPNSVGVSPFLSPRVSPGGKHTFQQRAKGPRPSLVSRTEPDWTLPLSPAGSKCSNSPSPTSSHGSLSDLSRPPSSLFSRSTNLASGRSSDLSDIQDSDPEGRVTSPPRQPPPAGPNPHRSTSTATPPIDEQLSVQTQPLSPQSASRFHPPPDEPADGFQPAKPSGNTLAPINPGPSPALDSDHGLAALAFPSATWSSCPSPQRTTYRSGSKCTPSPPPPPPPPPPPQLESHCWPVLPPISPVKGRSGSAASRSSELSSTPSHVYDELEAIAPPSDSCPSLDGGSDSSGHPLPHDALTPGLAALTVGCDSGNLGSLSRVQLLLLDRPEPTALQSLSCSDRDLMEDWCELDVQYDPAGPRRPLTAGGVSERCDSAGEVQENKSDPSEDGSGSPSSWIVDPSPSYNMFRASPSPCSIADNGGPAKEEEEEEEEQDDQVWKEVESLTGGWRIGSPEQRAEDKDKRMEERRTKVLNMLSKLQDDSPHQPRSNKGCSNFEDFDFLAKYCIFSREKLAEYKRAFEAEDSDGDGYVSSLQVLLALKNIVPTELLSEEEEIYVYRILEMVDFRVTDGLVDLRLFAVIASLAQKVATMDDFMRSLINNMDFRSLEVRLFKAKQLFLHLLEEQQGDVGAQRGFISAEQLLLELKAGGIHLDQEAAVKLELQNIPPLDLLDFLAYLPLFMLIHKSVISNPLDDSGNR